MFPPTCSAVPFRPEQNTRPDPPTPEILDPACAERGRGVHRFALDPPSSTCQVNGPGQAQAEGGRASAGRGEAGERRLEESERDQGAKATEGPREVERLAMRKLESRGRMGGGNPEASG